MRLFSALWPSEQALAHLESAFRQLDLPAGVRPVPVAKWHLTLAFYGNDASLQERAGHLDEHAAGRRAPTLRCAGAGTFGGVLWVGAQPVTQADREALRVVATAAGADREFRPHITVARWRPRGRQRPPVAALVAQLADYRGPTWTTAEVSLVQSRPGADYARVHGVPLIAW